MTALESEMNSWGFEKIKWDEYIIDILEVQEYRIEKFLTKNLEGKFDVGFLFIARANIEWRNIVILKGLEEWYELLKEVGCLKDILTTNIKCIDVKIMDNKDQREKTLKKVKMTFISKMELLK